MATSPVPFFPALVQVRPQWTDSGSRVHECVLWMTGSVSAGYSSAQLLNLAGVVFGDIANVWVPIGAPNSQLASVIATDWTSNTGLTATTTTSPTSGTGTGELGANTSVLLSIKSPVRYRGGHGRVYLPAIAGNATSDGRTVISSKVTSTQTLLNSFLTDLSGISSANGGPFVWGTYHFRKKNPTPPPTYLSATFNSNAGVLVQSTLATQRRRLRKAAHH